MAKGLARERRSTVADGSPVAVAPGPAGPGRQARGNAARQEDLVARGLVGTDGGDSTTLPFRSALEAAFGTSLAFLDVRQGPDAERELDELGAQAAEVEGTLLLPTGADQDLVAHEVAHGLQRQRGGGAGSGEGRGDDTAERGARLAASAVQAGLPARVGQPATGRVHRTPDGEDTTAQSDPVEVTDTLLYVQQGQGLIVIRAPVSQDPIEIELAFDDAGATTCSVWQEVHPDDPTYALFYALLQAREAGPSAVDYETLAPAVNDLVGQDVLAAGMIPGPWAPPGDQPIPFYIGNSAHVAIAQAYAAERIGELVFTNFTPISTIVESMTEMGLSAVPDALSGGKGALRPDILNATERSIYEIKPEASVSAAVAESAIYVAAFAEAGIVITMGAPGAPGTEGMVPGPDGFFVYWSPAPGAIVYQYTKDPEPRDVPVPVPVEEPVDAPVGEPEFHPFSWEYWEKVTGLTGIALVLYLIASEGSRLYLPRNAVPVP
ncbi:MAG: DUF4157 domain-containing protein [Deltaproteobacteria bacterium]|nr:MAG: DUF4157 domain-containing protein [Deltaproteobacteria bacterium]